MLGVSLKVRGLLSLSINFVTSFPDNPSVSIKKTVTTLMCCVNRSSMKITASFLSLLYASIAILIVAHAAEDVFDTGGLSRNSFPEGFVFGTSASAYQVEGATTEDGRGPCIWDVYVSVPGRVANNATAEVSADQYHHYKEDVDLMVKLNFDAYRFSISWSRIFPNGSGEVNQKGVDYYNRLIDYLLRKGITPYANLYHSDLPEALEEKYNGLLSRDVVKDFADYADFCFKTFGDRVKNWFTFNEPRVIAALGYDLGQMPPSRCSKEIGNCSAGDSGTEPYIVAHNIILSHAAAVKRYREKYQKEEQGRIGIILDFDWYEPLTSSKADNDAAQRARDFHIGWFLHPITYGEYPRKMQELVGDRLPKFTESEVQMVNGSIDYVGINQYTSNYIFDPPMPKSNITSYQNDWDAAFAFDRNGVQIGPRAHLFWLYIVPWGMYSVLTYVKERYGNPTMIVTENGMDDPGNLTFPNSFNDTTRINYFRDYLTYMKKAIDDGANVVGYFAWSLLDNFEWSAGYTSRFGIIYVDFGTLKRYPKMSAYWFKQLLRRDQ